MSEVREELLNLAIILKENTLVLKGIREQLPACCAHMMYCLHTQQPYNLAYFFARRITHLKGNSTILIPYGMFLTRLYHYIMNFHSHLRGPQYSLFDPVMEPINEFHISSIFISSLSVDYDIYDDPTLENEEQAKVKNVMQQEQVTSTIDKTTS
ncbi:hypothetical protein CTI12_AA232930 [Artemisia annua]|uniref:Uncharacterized protein n=1 Tax=Artemisia annua TaxID=35608 RepID=A0A2U1NSR1_ARTAN|nr:hypothetical protein CTI12_AA232930 [Artemisia annua]